VIVPLALLAGLASSLLVVRGARRKGPQTARRVYAMGLAVAALLYLAFALLARASAEWLAIEAVGVVLYGLAAVIAFRRWPAALAVGWVAHVAWDVGLHLDSAGAAHTPDWYPWLCVSFDLVLAAAVVAPARRSSSAAEC